MSVRSCGVLWLTNLIYRIRHVVENVIAVLLLGFQYVPIAGWCGLMVFPLAIFLTSILWNLPKGYSIETQIRLLLSSGFWFVAFTGFVFFLISFVQFLRRKTKIVTTGLYSVVRHPQYVGIIILTLGITLIGFFQIQVWIAWFIEVLGYILLAFFEERHLLKEYGEEYLQYRQKVPFMITTRILGVLILSFIMAFFLSFFF